MKKRVSLLLIFVLVLSLALTGCAGGEEPAAEEPAEGEEAPAEEEASGDTLNLAFATGGTSGTYYPLGGAIANVWNQTVDGVNVTIQPAGASVENINRVSSGEVDIVMAMNNIADQAWKGEGESFPNELKDFRAVGVVYPEVMHIVTTQDSGIESIYDLEGKTVNPGPPGSGTYVTAYEILNAFGIERGDFTENPGSFSDAVTGLKDGNIDAAFAVVSFPSSAVTQIATTNPVKILEVTGDEFDKLQENVPFAAQFPITGGEYNGQDEDATTVALQAVMYVRKDLDEDLVYNLTKNLYEQTEEIAKGHARGNQISIDRATDGVTTPFHPGAEKYLEEQGAL
jgi:TRAP transporter TAXI family solute receptor